MTCTHPRAAPGLDRCYCPDCHREFTANTTTYQEIHNRYAIRTPQKKISPRQKILGNQGVAHPQRETRPDLTLL